MLSTIKKTWDWIKSKWPWGRKQVTVAPPPEDIVLVPIEPPPPLRVEIEIVPPVFAPTSPIHALDVDTQLKRMSVLALRYGRLPFGRRFTTPIPDGTISQADRQIIGAMYSGILAGEAPAPVVYALVDDAGRKYRHRLKLRR